nr:hypothetical protein Itr_chr02CG19560 [Ipomoea trifida]
MAIGEEDGWLGGKGGSLAWRLTTGWTATVESQHGDRWWRWAWRRRRPNRFWGAIGGCSKVMALGVAMVTTWQVGGG